jgi:hypothetical protein
VSPEQVLTTGASVAVAVIAFVGAYLGRRALARAGRVLEATNARIAAAEKKRPESLAKIHAVVDALRAQGERAATSIGEVDDRIAAAEGDLRAWRAASDSLRAQLIRGHANLNRVREGSRLVLRVIELRRVFLG